MHDDAELTLFCPPDQIKVMLECYKRMKELNLDTDMLDTAIKQEIYMLAVGTERAYLSIKSDYEKEFDKPVLVDINSRR